MIIIRLNKFLREQGRIAEPTPIYIQSEENKIETIFRDTITSITEDKTCCERVMLIDGKEFCVNSFFDNMPKSTPTEKLITLIDYENSRKS